MAARRQRISGFADLIAEGVAIKDAAKRLGVSETAATAMMATMRQELGWQAA